MATPLIDGFLFAWKKNQDYAPSLVADLTEEQMILQPAVDPTAPANHPAWVLSHLNVYIPIIGSIIKGEAFDDPKPHRFGMLSQPTSDPSTYQSKEELIAEFTNGHLAIAELLGNEDDRVFEKTVALPRWQEVMPTAAIALPYLMFNHENGHLGQVSAWRRIQGLPSV
ncbi:MAG: DinB family protein [Planctomycetaceae bacterium]|nr:DinB family protein [Planctomycetaceae bacterium]MCP4480636.1 DinB family protein [Planctomycetaceae bacterium]MCP4776425.1 DinB family protein [Planctomycetaceae bacterium]